MNDLSNRGPLGPKADKPTRKPRQGLPPVSAKKAAFRKSEAGREGLAYMGRVKMLPCVICGARPSEAHHCRDMPENSEQGLYDQLPAAGRKSGARDTIPLCPIHHRIGPEAYHTSPARWREKHGPDYGFIGPTRVALDDSMEIDF